MPQCKDCKFFNQKVEDSSKGDCFGHEVPAETDSASCPTGSFQPRDGENAPEQPE